MNIMNIICGVFYSCTDASMALTINSLETGLAVLANPLVNVEHDGKNLFVNILLKAPEI